MSSTEIRNLPRFDTDYEDLRPFAQVRLIVFDLDGTLVPATQVERAQKLISSARITYGVRTTIATGRTLHAATGLIDQLQIQNTPVVLYNGAVTINSSTHRIISQQTISANALAQVLRIAEQHDLTVYAFFHSDPSQTITKPGLREFVFGWTRLDRIQEAPKSIFGIPVSWRQESAVPLEPAAILLEGWSSETALSAVHQLLASQFGISVTSSGGRHIEIRPSGVSKASALTVVTSLLGLSPAQVLVLGDNDNDREMLEWAGIGVCVNTASTGALAASKFVCHYGPFQGAVEVLKLVRAARRYFS
jgi:Cof subfamily protein (haloacid dehalogenase superfamily)